MNSITSIEQFLCEHFNKDVIVSNASPLSGGDINAVFKVETSCGTFCIKQNDRYQFPEMLKKEAAGLEELSSTNSTRISEVIGHFEDAHNQYLLLKFIEKGKAKTDFWEDFGQSLAKLHSFSKNSFGFESDNYIGSMIQTNSKKSKWSSFYAEQRILPQLQLAFEAKLIDRKILQDGERLCMGLEELFPEEKPALLHGDLWSGNFLIDAYGEAVLIDPAVYYGHREMDIGMMQLFGGFSDEIYNAYNDHFPLENSWRARIPLTQLYPLLVHVNLFGKSYVQSVRSVLQKYK